MSGNRIHGNSADEYPSLYGFLGSINAQKNWWGRNAAPTSAPALVGGSGIDASHPMQLTLTPTPPAVSEFAVLSRGGIHGEALTWTLVRGPLTPTPS